jgi:hypothetical protein
MAKATKKKPASTHLVPPPGGAIVRMYRIGHGDCFLIAFAAESGTRPVYVLIDCGYKPGSPGFIEPATTPDAVVADIRNVTGGHIDVAVITHEHQDHVNAITETRFADFKIDQTWMAWTESEDDKLAKLLRKRFKDRLKALALASSRLAASDDKGDKALAARLDALVALEIGGEGEVVRASSALAAAAAPSSWTNKDSMKLFRHRAGDGVKCLYPHRTIVKLPGATHVRVFPLGPPYDEKQIEDLEPQGAENFRKHGVGPNLEVALSENGVQEKGGRPFARRHGVELAHMKQDEDMYAWFEQRYGIDETAGDEFDPGANRRQQIANNARFRRIDLDWLRSAEQLALAMGDYTNNSSLVLAFELGEGGKVLLFAADAQRGNWASWASKPFKEGKNEIDVRELLGRTVLYKVGHHGSHNATLKGKADGDVPNLSWLGRGEYASEFTAMITAVRKWAMQPHVKWDHPLKAIKDALIEKAAGRVFQTDTEFKEMTRPDGAGKTAWAAFQKRASGTPLFFDLRIEP